MPSHLSRSTVFTQSVEALGGLRKTLLISGCLVMVGCFFAWENLAFRQVYFLLIIPAFLAMKNMDGAGVYPLMRATLLIILALMWWDAASVALKASLDALEVASHLSALVQICVWVVRQLFWWHVIAVFCGILIVVVRSSRTMRDLRDRMPGLFSWVRAA